MARFANKPAITSLSSGLAGTGAETTLNVGSTEGWPVPAAGEVAKGVIAPGASSKTVFSYTGLTATTFTGVVQGIEDTTAAPHVSGTTVEHQITAQDLERSAPLAIRKAVAETVTSSTTLQADDDLFFTIGVSERWAFDFYLFVSGSSGGDISIGFIVPGTQTGFAGGIGPATTLAASAFEGDAAFHTASFATETVLGNFGVSTTGGTSAVPIHIFGHCNNGTAAAATFGLTWAQATSNATATTMHIHSLLIARRIQ